VVFTPDLVLTQDGQPVVIVEAKRRAIPSPFESPVLHQLRAFAERTGAKWIILAEPETIRIYRSDQLQGTAIRVPTREVFESTLPQTEPVGERTLLLALNHWLLALPRSGSLAKHPDLSGLAEDLTHVDFSNWEFTID
jgi:hypothetical protein